MARDSTFGRLLRELRRRANLTQQDLADALELDFTYISKIERAKAGPPARDKIGLAAVVLKASAAERDELFMRAAKMPKEFEEWIIARPEMLRLYRTIRRYPKRKQEMLIERLIGEAEQSRPRQGRKPKQARKG